MKYVPTASKVSNVQVGDGTDGKLVHLDGLNFSRAWGLYRIARRLGGEEGERWQTLPSIQLNLKLSPLSIRYLF